MGMKLCKLKMMKKTTNYRRTRKTLPKRSPDARIPKNVPVETHSGSDSDRANAKYAY